VTAMVGHAVGFNANPALVPAAANADPPARRGITPDTPIRSDRPDGADKESMEVRRPQPSHGTSPQVPSDAALRI
jgi:hypothetical protein